MYKTKFLFILFLLSASTFHAQQLLSPSHSYSHKKTSYVTLKDGTVITGTLKDLDYKKGLIDFVNIEDGAGKKWKLKPEKISIMYLPPTSFDNMTKAMDFAGDAQKWNSQKLDQDLIHQGYVYFENAKVKVKKKEGELLMQLLNPTFAEKVKVYHDPYANESNSFGVGGVTVAGGNEKSYYVQTDNNAAAFKLEKKDYKDQYTAMWQKCPAVKKEYPKPAWEDLTKHVIAYSNCSK